MKTKNNYKKILVISEDSYLVQTYTGFWGTFFKKFYVIILSFRLRILLRFLSSKNILISLNADTFNLSLSPKIKIIKYSEQISKINIEKNRHYSIKITEQISQKLFQLIKSKRKKQIFNPFDLWRMKTAVNFSYNYFPHYGLIEKLIIKYKPDEIYTLGFSKEERIASVLAKKHNIKINYIGFFDLSWVNNLLIKFLFLRQIKSKKEMFFKNASKKYFSKQKKDYLGAYLLSVDFVRHLKMLIPLYKKFKEKNKKIFLVSDIQNLEKFINNLYGVKEDYFYLTEFINLKKISHILPEFIKEYSFIWKEFYKSFHHKGESNKDYYTVTEEVIETMKDYLEVVIKNVMPLAEIYLEATRNLINTVKPKGIICLNDARMMENSFLTTASKYNIKTLIAYPGMFLSTDKTSKFNATYFAAIGKFVKNELLKIHYSKEKIKVVGDSQLDLLIENKNIDINNIYKKINITSDKKAILLISDRINPMLSFEEKKYQFQKVSEAIKNFKNVQLIIKPHPTEKRKSLINDIKSWGVNNCVISDNEKIELFELLRIASVVIIAWSMVGFEAMLFKVPVIVANFSGKDYDLRIPYIKGGGAIQVKTVEGLQRYIRMMINPNNPQRKDQIKKGLAFCNKYYRLPIGGASDRIYKLMCNN